MEMKYAESRFNTTSHLEFHQRKINESSKFLIRYCASHIIKSPFAVSSRSGREIFCIEGQYTFV